MTRLSFGNAIGWNLAGSVARIALTLVCQLVLLRFLGPVPAGHFAIFLFIVGLGSILSDGGMTAVLARSPIRDDRLIRNALFLVLTYSISGAAILIAFTPVFMRLFQMPAAELYIPIVAALNVIPLALSAVPFSVLKQQYRARDLQLVQLVAYFVGFVAVAMPLTFASHSALVLVAAFTTQTIVSLICAIFISRCPVTPNWRGAKAIRGVGGRALLANIASYINESMPNVLTAHVLGPRAVGVYSTTWNLLRVLTDVMLGSLHAPLLVSTAQDDHNSVTRDRFLSTLRVLASTALPVYIVVLLCGSQIAASLLGPKWNGSGPVLSVLALVAVSRMIGGLSGAILWGRGRFGLDTAAQLLAAAVMVAGFVVFRLENALQVAWIVAVGSLSRTLMLIVIGLPSCGISVGHLGRRLLLPSVLTVLVMLPIRWIGPAVAPDASLRSFLSLGVAAATLLGIRIALELWRTPAMRTRLTRTLPSRFRRVPPGVVRDPANPDQIIISTSESP